MLQKASSFYIPLTAIEKNIRSKNLNFASENVKFYFVTCEAVAIVRENAWRLRVAPSLEK